MVRSSLVDRSKEVDHPGVVVARDVGFHLVDGGDVERGVHHVAVPGDGALRVEGEHLLADHGHRVAHIAVAGCERAVEAHVAEEVLSVCEVGPRINLEFVGAVGGEDHL